MFLYWGEGEVGKIISKIGNNWNFHIVSIDTVSTLIFH